jgi:hypothetical protein
MFKSKRRQIVIPQSEHLRQVGSLAMLWGNSDFDMPLVERISMVAGMALHDRGYGHLDNSAIGEMSEDEWQGIARRSFSMYNSDIVTDTIIKYHVRRLASYYNTHERKALTVEFSQAIKEQLQAHNLSKVIFERLDRITELIDNISFLFCMDVPNSGAVSIFPRNNSDTEVPVQYDVADGVMRVTPWPFSVDRFESYIFAYHLDGYPAQLDPFILTYRLERK